MLCPILIHPFLLPSALKCVCVYWFFRDQSMNYFIIPYIVYLLYNWKTEAPCYWQEYIVLISSISPPTNQGIVCLHLRYCIIQSVQPLYPPKVFVWPVPSLQPLCQATPLSAQPHYCPRILSSSRHSNHPRYCLATQPLHLQSS